MLKTVCLYSYMLAMVSKHVSVKWKGIYLNMLPSENIKLNIPVSTFYKNHALTATNKGDWMLRFYVPIKIFPTDSAQKNYRIKRWFLTCERKSFQIYSSVGTQHVFEL